MVQRSYQRTTHRQRLVWLLILLIPMPWSTAAVSGGPAVILTESQGSTVAEEGGVGDFYTLELNSMPTGTVTVAIQAGMQVTTQPASTLTFTTANWNVPQQVTVAAVDDALVEGNHAEIITHAALGGGFSGAATPSLQVLLFDNDRAVTDLAVGVSLLTQPIRPGQRITYQLRAENLTAGADALTPFFAFGLPNDTDNMSWTCSPDPGATCPASGSGFLGHAVSLPGGTGVSYTVQVDLSLLVPEGTPINATAAIEANDSTDPDLANNSATRTDLVAQDRILKDSFEN